MKKSSAGHVEFKAILFLVLASLCWAMPPTFSIFVVYEFTPFFVTAFRLLFSIIFFAPFMLKADNRKKIRLVPKRVIIILALSGSCFFGPHYVFFFLGMRYTYATHTTVLINFGYVIATVFYIIFLKDSINRRKIAGIAISIIGIILIAWPQGTINQGNERVLEFSSVLFGDFLIFIYLVLWSFYALINKKYLSMVGNIPAIVFVYVFGLVVVLPFSLMEFPKLFHTGPLVWLGLIMISLFGSVLGYFLYNAGLKHVEGSKASMILLSSPVFGIILAIFIAGESIGWLFIIGTALIIFSAFLVIRESRQ
ncbi:MAG: DMT family transporter [Promethearchaeota archaeon]